MRTTNKFDVNDQEIFEGDKVIYVWGWKVSKGKVIARYQIHTITVKEAHLMNNGEMHDDGDGVIFCLGKSYNFWEGKKVQKLTKEQIEEVGIEDDTDFIINDEGIAVKL